MSSVYQDKTADGRFGLSRRQFLQRATVLGFAIPAGTVLLAACGSDDDEPAATATGQATATSGTSEATPTEMMDEPTPTGEMDEPTATSGTSEGTPTAEGEATTPPSGGTFYEGGDRLMGQEFEPGQPGGVFIEAFFDPPFIEPFWTSTTTVYALIRNVYEALIEPNPFTLEPVGLLAESWEVSEDAINWTFFLREGVTFHDGEAFNADDVVFSYQYQLDESLEGGRSSHLNALIAGVQAVDELSVQVTAVDVFPDFLMEAGTLLIGAEHILSGIDPAEYLTSAVVTGSDPAMVIGTGPFKFVELVPEDHVTFERFDEYWDGAPYLDQFIYRSQASSDENVTGLLAGENDFVYELGLVAVPELEAAGFIIDQWETSSFVSVVVNNDADRSPFLSDPVVRQALLFGLDREAMAISHGEGISTIAETILAPTSPFCDAEGVTVRYPYDPERAMALLDEAGWVLGDDGVREKDGVRLSFTLMSESGWAPYNTMAEIAQENWRQIGVDVTAEIIVWATMVEMAANRDFDAWLRYFPGGLVPDRTPQYGCESPDNLLGYCNPDLDALLEQARTTFDQEQRVELYTEFQNLVLTDLPVLPLIFPNGASAAAPRVHNPPRGNVPANYWFAVEKIWVEQ
jgi:peptide/nickel transport system substrate-binding protein